jgi:hypothetical protein
MLKLADPTPNSQRKELVIDLFSGDTPVKK